MSITLQQTLALVGRLDDSAGDETARERFRGFLKENVTEVGQIRDYVEECLRSSGTQYNRALQDLVNHLGRFLGFEVVFGRYQGVPGEVGFDGIWKSAADFHVVVEVKTTEVYAIKTATLVGYVDSLISERKIPDWDKALGLYVVGRLDPEIRQLENAIVAEKRTSQLRIISVGSLLSLAELVNEYDISHDDILAVMRPSGPSIDAVADLMARLVAQPKEDLLAQPESAQAEPAQPEIESKAKEPLEEVAYWLTPVKSDEEGTAEETVRTLVGQEHIYAFGERTPGRTHLKPGDWICFYATTKGIIAHGRVASAPEKMLHPKVRHQQKYPWVFRLDNVRLYVNKPVVLDAATRSRLESFRGRELNKAWAWFVQATHKLTPEDFKILTQHG